LAEGGWAHIIVTGVEFGNKDYRGAFKDWAINCFAGGKRQPFGDPLI